MVIIAYRVVIGEVEKIGKISLSHGIVAHCHAALVGILICHRRVSEPPSHGNRNPGKQVELAAAWVLWRDVRNRAIGLLPHLIEAMHRVAGVTCVGGIRDCVSQERLTAIVQL